MATELERLVAKEGITIETKPGAASPISSAMQGMQALEVTLKYRDRKLRTPFFTTPGYQLSAADVLCNLCREARSLDETGDSFELWAKKNGHNSDSRAAYSAWDGIRKSNPRLKKLLGRRFKEFSTAKHG